MPTNVATRVYPDRNEELKFISHRRLNQLFSKRVVYHVVFWLVFYFFNAAYLGYVEVDWEKTIYSFTIRFPFVLFACYINMYLLIPKFYYQNKLIGYFFFALSTIIVLNTVNLWLLDALIQSDICPKSYEALSKFTATNFLYKGFYILTIVGLTSGIKLSKDHLKQNQKLDLIEKEKLSAELQMLRSQMQPHFFFNTLNNLYALTIKKSDAAPDIVLKLSDLMSYVLYESDQDKTKLSKEIEHIQNYIELERLRLNGNVNIKLDIVNHAQDKEVPPLIFLPFIENSFKHGVGNQANDAFIHIKLVINKEGISFRIENSIAELSSSKRRTSDGIGLKNVRRRLDLIYGNRYTLVCQREDKAFVVELNLPLI